ncbi:MAG: pantoate--beta-alanine ligase [Kiritimatiellia bacterium]|jgi:pantoate--beta-alanine ligase
MQLIHSIEAMRDWSRSQRASGKTTGFVPTMGYLHAGHLSLVEIAKARADAVVVSIFVNPTQFGPGEDLDRYPRDFARDERLCREAGVEVLFYPEASTMYPPGYSTYVMEEALGEGLCGAARPGHFRGVTTVVTKLFNIVQPDICVLGEKDAQQLRVLRRMTRDLNLPVEIVPGPTVRETDGLAMSSRNAMLAPEERAQAVWLHRALRAASDAVARGERSVPRLRELVTNALANATAGVVDYIAFVDDETMRPVEAVDAKTLLALAVRFPSARLIDNLTLDPDQ